MASTKVPSELIANSAITGQHLHTNLGNTGVTANSSGLFIGQDVSTSSNVQFNVATASHAGTIAAATTGTTQANTDNSAKIATTAFVTNKVTELIGGAPGTLDTLNELAAAINDDANYNSTLTTALATKAPIASPTFTGTGRMNGDWVVGAATGEDKFVVAPQAAGSGTILISYNDAGNAYEPLKVDFETLDLRTSGVPRISIAGNGDIDLGDTTVKADGQLLVNLTSSDVGASVNAIEADGGFRFRNGNRGIKNNDGSYETWLARSLTGNKTIYGEKLTVDVGNNRVGINTTSPGRTLDVKGSVQFSVNTNSHETFVFSTQGVDEAKQIMKNAANVSTIVLNTNGVSYVNGGNVGINTDTPDYTLEVVGDSMIGDASAVTSPAFAAQQQIVKSFTYGASGAGRAGNLYLLNTNTGGDSGLITFGGYSDHTNNLYYQTGAIGGGTEAQDGGSWGGYLSFITTSDGSKGSASGMYEHMRITADGHIQIKQTGSAPTNSVMLPGHIEFKGQGWDSNSGSDDMNAKIEMAATYGKVGSGATSPELVFSLQGAGGLDSSSESYVEGMRLVGAGAYNNNQPRLGIGTASPSKALDVYTAVNTGGIQITGGSGATNTSLHINNTGTSGVNWNITSTGGGHGYGDGQLHFGVAYGVPKMKITGDGYVGIGHATGSHQPRKFLEVECPSEDFVTLGARTLGVSSNWAGIHFGYKEDNLNYRKSAIVFERTDRYSNNAQGKVHILNGPVSGAGSATLADAKFTINEDGNVGIGIQSPIRKLDIVGDTTSQGQYPLGLDATNTDYTMEFRRNGVSEWWIAQSASAFRIHENGVADMFRINATDGNIVLGRTRGTDTETSYTQQTFQFPLDAHVNGADEAAEEKDAVFSKIWRKSAILHPGQYSNGNYYIGIGVTGGASVSYVVFKLNVDKATELFASTYVANSADGTTRANKIYYSLDDENWTLLQSENWSAGGNTCSSTLTLSSHAGSSGGFFTGTVFLKFAIEGTGSSHTNLIGWQEFNIRARAQHASLTGGGFQRSKNDLTLAGNSNTGHGYAPLLHAYSHQFTGTNGAAIVASNGGTQTFASQGLGYLDRAIFDFTTNASHGANGIQVLRSGVLTCQFLQDIITTNSSGYLSCTVRRYNEALTASTVVCQTLRTHTNSSWDMIQGAFACDVVAGDIITFTFAAATCSSMDNNSWSHYVMTITPTATTGYGNAATNLPWVHQ